VQELRLQIRAATAELAQQLGHMPTDAELAACLNVSERELAQARQAFRAFQASSLDAPLPGDDAGNLGDFLGDDDRHLDQITDMDAVWTPWAEPPEREQRLLQLPFHGNMTQAEIAAELGMSQMHSPGCSATP
jgi:RNA polymerase sigma-B factor